MAEGALRQSNRIKSRTRTIYTEDDFDYNLLFDVSDDISPVFEPLSEKKKNVKKKPSTNVSKKVGKKTGQLKKSCTENAKPAFRELTVHLDVDSNANCISGSQTTCSLCNKVFNSEKVLQEHMTQHKDDDGKLEGFLVCGTCDRICMDKSSYERHIKSHSEGRKFKCDLCDKNFIDNHSLKRHVKTHFDDRPFPCDLCFKSFRDNPSLLRHQQTHTERPRTCNCLKCGKTFTDKHSLKRHERTHSVVRPFECKTCLKKFRESGSFKRHLKIHAGVRNFFCHVCNRSFLEKQSLMRHQKNVCGFGDTGINSSASFFNVDHSIDSRDSCAEHSEISHTSIREDNPNVLNDNSLTSDSFNTKPSASPLVKPKTVTYPSDSKTDNFIAKSSCDLTDAPSLHSLIQKDPNLYNSISEIVESIDSYEKMLDLCGESGHVAIDSVLTRKPVSMPDNILCFECGEPLVNGENFKADSKNFHPSSCNSFKCLSCDDNNEDDYGEPPVLTAEIGNDRFLKKQIDENDMPLQENLKKDPALLNNGFSKNILVANKSIAHSRDKSKIEHWVFFNGNDYDDDDTNELTDASSLNDTVTRTNLSDTEINYSGSQCNSPDKMDSKGIYASEESQQNISPKKLESSITIEGQHQERLQTNITPKMEYETDDLTIPSVFPCHLCTKVFSTSAFLTRHLDLHKNSPHKCLVCGKTFTSSPSLKRHMMVHTGEKPYTCPFCGKRFRDPSNFYKHRKICSKSLSVPSPVDSIVSTSSISSSQSLDDSSLGDHEEAYTTDSKQKMSFQFSPFTTASTSVPLDMPLKFTCDKGGSLHSPVPLSQLDSTSDTPTATSASPPPFNQNPDTNGRSKSDVKPQGMTSLLFKDKKADTGNTGLLIPCTLCDKTFESQQCLGLHMNYHSGDPKVTCIECGKSFADSFGLKRHSRIHAGVRPHVCEYCGRGYCDHWNLKKHWVRGCLLTEVKIPVDFMLRCTRCTRVFSEVEYLDEHMKTHSGSQKYECDICQKRFSEAFNLKRHHRLHMAVCPGCDQEFKDVKALTEHQANECPVNVLQQDPTAKEDGFPCPDCGRVYTSKPYLERHKKFHSGIKPFVCEICDKRFFESSKLKRHLKVHGSYKASLCEICKKMFTDTDSLKQHLASSSCGSTKNEQPAEASAKEKEPLDQPEGFPCRFCTKIFPKNFLLSRHMRVHRKDRPFACSQCERVYKDKSSLWRHQFVHKGFHTYVCPKCDKGFYYSDSLRRHISTGCCNNNESRHNSKKSKNLNKKRKPNNNINIKNNTFEKGIKISNPNKIEGIKKNATYPQKSTSANKTLCKVLVPVGDMKTSYWSCHRKKQCWRCDLNFKTKTSLLKHHRIHCHKKPYHCLHCFIRWSRKMYWKGHLNVHKPKLENERTGSLGPSVSHMSVLPGVFKRPQRSIQRASWEWISKL